MTVIESYNQRTTRSRERLSATGKLVSYKQNKFKRKYFIELLTAQIWSLFSTKVPHKSIFKIGVQNFPAIIRAGLQNHTITTFL